MNLHRFAAALAALVLSACAATPAAPQSQQGHWTALFSGHDLTGWTPKFVGHPLGENYNDTFRVRDGLLTVNYDQYTTFDGRFGHLFYIRPFANYRLRAVYRFVGQQVAGGPDWGVRNNGLMLHSQPPETMELDQDFPISIEFQLLGGDGVTPRSTANLCTPGLSVLLNGERSEQHCFPSSAPTFVDNEWVTVEVEVHENRSIRHFVNGQLVMEYSAPLTDEPHPWAPDRELKSGYIAIQSESAPTEFRSIEIMQLPAE
jgi:3-keto-disaccharide hydrolase